MSSKPFYPEQLQAIAEQFGTPTYVYSESSVEQQIDKFRSAFGKFDVRLLYAMKANSHPWMLRTILAKGVGIDAVSPAEAILATRCGCAPSSVFYSPNNSSLSELDWAAEQGFVVNLGEFSRVEGFTHNHPGSDICVRLNLNIGAGHHDHVVTGGEKSKFGILHSRLANVIEVAAGNNCRITGIHQHIGSGSTDP